MESCLDHVGVVVGDLDRSVRLLEECFGLVVDRTVSIPERGVRAAFLPWGEVPLELIEIAGGAVPEGFHHLALDVGDLDQAVRRVHELGMTTSTDAPQTLDGRRTILVEQGGPGGIRLQLLERVVGGS